MKHIFKEGNEDYKICYVCQSNIDIHKNPDLLQCPECSDVSHYACMIKWFKTSSHCPVCRNPAPIDNANEEMVDILAIDEEWQLNDFTAAQVNEAIYDSDDSELKYIGKKQSIYDSEDE